LAWSLTLESKDLFCKCKRERGFIWMLIFLLVLIVILIFLILKMKKDKQQSDSPKMNTTKVIKKQSIDSPIVFLKPVCFRNDFVGEILLN
jgi:hypothetical protein